MTSMKGSGTKKTTNAAASPIAYRNMHDGALPRHCDSCTATRVSSLVKLLLHCDSSPQASRRVLLSKKFFSQYGAFSRVCFCFEVVEL